MPVTVLVVDDHPVVRTGIRAVLDAHPEVSVVGEAATGEEAVRLTGLLRPQVVLCDLRLGEGLDGIATTRALRGLDPAPAVLILTTYDRDADILGAVEGGAAGYLLKDVAPETIIEAVQAAADGGVFLPPELAARVMAGVRRDRPRLTARELDVLRLLATGLEPGDRPVAVRQRGDRQVPSGPRVRQARRRQSGPGRPRGPGDRTDLSTPHPPRTPRTRPRLYADGVRHR